TTRTPSSRVSWLRSIGASRQRDRIISPVPRTIAINAAIVGERPTGLGVFALSVIQALADLGERLVVFTSRPDLVTAPNVGVLSAPAMARPERGAVGHVARLLWAQSGLRLRVAPEQIHVVLCGYDRERFCAGGPVVSDGGEPYALYVGNVMPHKNLLRLVDAVARARFHAPFRLVMRGSGHARHVAELRAAIDARGLAPFVDWQPYAAADTLPALYRGARVLVLPSLYEGFGLTALEAMACGTAVVTTSTSSLPEVVGDAALLVDPHDIGALADAVVRVITDDALAKTLGARGLARAPLF